MSYVVSGIIQLSSCITRCRLKNITFVTKFPPFKKRSGSEIATCNFLESMVRCGFNPIVHCLGNLNDKTTAGVCPDNFPCHLIGDAKMAWNDFTTMEKFVVGLKSFFSGYPISVAKLPYEKILGSIKRSQLESVLILEHSQIASIAFMGGINQFYFLSQNVESEIYYSSMVNSASIINKMILKRECALMRILERKVVGAAKQTWALSSNDAEQFNSMCQGKSLAFPVYGHEIQPELLKKYDGIDAEFDLVLLGMWTWLPNKQGVDWFLSSIFPRLGRQIKVLIGGRGSTSFVKQCPGIVTQEYVEDAYEFLRKGKIHVIPSTSGGGIQIKTLNSIAWGIPTVVSPFGMRGIDDPPVWCIVADGADSFVAAIEKMLFGGDKIPHVQRRFLKEGVNWQRRRRDEFDLILTKSMNNGN